MKWQPIETAPKDGTAVLIKYANGKVAQGAIDAHPPSKQDIKELAKDGVWPDHKNWRMTGWAPLPEPPEVDNNGQH